LVVEALSDSTRRRDLVQKRAFYLDAGIPEYWIIDPEAKNVRVVRRENEDQVVSGELIWAPREASEPLKLDVGNLFSDF
jgi:Uma2 family endonuclease